MALDLFQRTMEVAQRPRFEEATRLPVEWSEGFNTSWSHGVLFDQSFAILNARNAAIDDVINEAYGQTRDERFRLESIAASRKGGERMLDLYNARVIKYLKENPEREVSGFVSADIRPLSDDELDVRAADKARVARDEFKAMQAREKTWGGAFGTFAGGAAAAIVDPVNLVTFPLAAPRALGVLKTGLAWGGIGAGTQAAIEVAGAPFREQVEPGYLRSGEPGENIVGAAVFAGGIGSGLKVLGNSWRYLKTREWPRSLRDAGNVVESEAQIADTNPFRGVEGEVAHREALSKTIDDVVAGRPAAVDRTVTPEVMATYEGRITPIMKARQAALEAQQTAELLAREDARLPPTMERLSEQQLAEIRTAADEIGAGLTRQQAALAEGVAGARTAATKQAATVEQLRREVEELRGDFTARQAEGKPTAAVERSLGVRERQLTKAQARAEKLATAAEERAAREPLRQVTAEARAATGKKRAESELRLALGRLAEQGYGLRLAPGEVQAMAARIMTAPADEVEIVLRETTETLVERAKAARATAEPLPLGAPLRPHEEQRAVATRLSNLMRTRIQTLAREVGYAMPRDEAQIIAARLLTANEGESLAILDELVVRPRTLAKTINEPPPAVPADLPTPPAPKPGIAPAVAAPYEDALAKQLTPPETAKLAADPEHAATIDRDLQRMRAETPDKEVPVGRDAEGNPVTRTVEDMADEVEQRRLLAEEIKASCGPQPEPEDEGPPPAPVRPTLAPARPAPTPAPARAPSAPVPARTKPPAPAPAPAPASAPAREGGGPSLSAATVAGGSGILAATLGGGVTVEPPTITTLPSPPPPTNFPTSEEAAFAQAQGAGYGSDAEAHIAQQVARVIGTTDKAGIFNPGSGEGKTLTQMLNAVADEAQSRNIDLTKPEYAGIREQLGNVFARTTLAVNRIPIAALGFDPGRVGFDVLFGEPGQRVTLGGGYSKQADTVFANLSSPSVLTHEFIHRGMQLLRQRAIDSKDQELIAAFRALPDEESVVRYLMVTQAGDPEKGEGSISDEERQTAINLFEGGKGARYRTALATITGAAQQEIKRRKPRGPR